MASISGLNSAQSSALAGIQRSHRSLDEGAARIAQGTASAHLSISAEGAQLAQENAPSLDLAGELVGLSLAKHLHAANVKVLQTTSEVEAEAVHMLDRDSR